MVLVLALIDNLLQIMNIEFHNLTCSEIFGYYLSNVIYGSVRAIPIFRVYRLYDSVKLKY